MDVQTSGPPLNTYFKANKTLENFSAALLRAVFFCALFWFSGYVRQNSCNIAAKGMILRFLGILKNGRVAYGKEILEEHMCGAGGAVDLFCGERVRAAAPSARLRRRGDRRFRQDARRGGRSRQRAASARAFAKVAHRPRGRQNVCFPRARSVLFDRSSFGAPCGGKGQGKGAYAAKAPVPCRGRARRARHLRRSVCAQSERTHGFRPACGRACALFARSLRPLCQRRTAARTDPRGAGRRRG